MTLNVATDQMPIWLSIIFAGFMICASVAILLLAIAIFRELRG